MSALTGFSEEDARRAICVLLALGLLVQDEGEPRAIAHETTVERAAAERLAPGPCKSGEPPVDLVMEAISRKLILFETADYYEILGVTRIATTTTAIRQAYSAIREMIESYRTSWPDHKELNSKLDLLSAGIEKAYATLSQLDKRMAYDQPKNRP